MNFKIKLKKFKYKYCGLLEPFYDERLKIISRTLKYISGIRGEGDYIEFGVYKGDSFIPAYLFAKYWGIKNMRFFAFDCFEGIPSKGEEAIYYKKGDCCCSYKNFKKILKDYDINDAIIVKGYYEKILNNELRKKLNLKKIKAVYIDCDLFSATKTALDWITPCLQDGTVLMYDDWFLCQNREDIGEQGATKQWLKENPKIKLTPYHSFNYGGMSFIINFEK